MGDNDGTTDPPTTDPPATDPPANGGATDDGAGGSGDVVAGVLAAVQGLGETITNALAGRGDGTEGTPVTTDPPPTDLDGQVRAAMARVGKEKEIDDRVARVEKAVEKQPIKQGRLSRALWGKVEA